MTSPVARGFGHDLTWSGLLRPLWLRVAEECVLELTVTSLPHQLSGDEGVAQVETPGRHQLRDPVADTLRSCSFPKRKPSLMSKT